MSEKITPQPEYDALYAFDAENNIEPASVVAERIAAKYGFDDKHAIVDDIHYAIEDAMEWGQRRGRLLPDRAADHIEALEEKLQVRGIDAWIATIDSENANLVVMWKDRALKAEASIEALEAALREIAENDDGPNEMARIARATLAPETDK